MEDKSKLKDVPAKVHQGMCLELEKSICTISQMLSQIDLATPKCKDATHALSSLHVVLEKARQLVQHCSDSSKLCLAITADRILLRCRKLHSNMEVCLSQLQKEVPSFGAKVIPTPLRDALIGDLLLCLTKTQKYYPGFIHSILCFRNCFSWVLIGISYSRFFMFLDDHKQCALLQLGKNCYMQICSIMGDVRSAKFSLDPNEVEAGMALKRLLRRDISPSNTFNSLEFEVIQVAALKLNLISRDSIFIEKKSIQEELKRSYCKEQKNKKILNYFLYLLRKYDEALVQKQCGSIEPELSRVQVKSQVCTSETSIQEPPREFKCPISSSLMSDPVIISSGWTFERIWIQRWIDNGNTTCPITGTKLEDLSLVPNSAIKCLISGWCKRYEIKIPDPCLEQLPALFLPSLNISQSSSMDSLGNRLSHLDSQSSIVSSCSSNMNCDAGFSDEKSQRFQLRVNACNVLRFVSSCDAQPSWASRCKAVYDLREQLEDNEGVCHSTVSACIAKPLINFLKNALDLGDEEAQRAGTELLLAIMSNNRDELLDLDEDEVIILAAFLDSDMAEKQLAILEILSRQPKLKSLMVASGLLPLISGVLNSKVVESRALALKILSNLSSNCSMESQSTYVMHIPNLIQFMVDPIIANSCIEIIKNLCDSEKGSSRMFKTSSCITEIAGFLVTGTRAQECTADVLHRLCYEREELIPLVVKENVFQPLVHMSRNGSCRGKVIAAELLQLLGHTSNGAYSECYSFSDVPADYIIIRKENKSVFKKLGFLQMKLPIFSKPIN